MATLILEHDNRRRAAVLRGRVVIGRRTNSHIVLPDRTVSRIHAWIGPDGGGRFFIADTGSRSGTIVNGVPIKSRKTLEDGDRIRIGPATIVFHSNGSLPPDAEELDVSDRASDSDDGIFLDCACGAPLWAPWDFGGRVGQCRYCGQMVELPVQSKRAAGLSDPCADTMAPGLPAAARRARPKKMSVFDAPLQASTSGKSAVAAAAAKPRALCGACQSPISLLEETTRCLDCGAMFHANCWTENRGCSSYGCKQVSALDPRPAPHAAAPGHIDLPEPNVAQPEPGPDHKPAVQWDYLFLPLALIAALAGMLTFGIPPLALGITLMVQRLRRRPPGRMSKMFRAAFAISFAAALLGAIFSWYWRIA